MKSIFCEITSAKYTMGEQDSIVLRGRIDFQQRGDVKS